jgi:amidase
MKKLLPILLLTALSISCTNSVDVDLREYDIAAFQRAMQNGELSSHDIVEYYLAEIDRIDQSGPELRSIIEINPDALAIAAALDQERAETGPRGPLHGIPVVLKANIDTGDQMHTTAGSLAMANHRARDDAFLVARLRDAGAIILGKSNLSEWANFRSDYSSSGWSSIGGQTRNPYDPTRNPCGSSSGSAVAVSANLTAIAIGTETDGSVVCPSGLNGIVGIKPTLGLVSRDGIIPIAHSQDTAGPMARTVTDAAILLNAMSVVDENDEASAARPESIPDYAAGLSPDALRGKRIGVLRTHFGAGENPKVESVLTAAIEILKSQGAIIVDPVELDTEGMSEAEGVVLDYEFKSDLNAYLQDSDAELKSLQSIMQFNIDNADTVMPLFRQERMDASQESGPLTDYKYLLALKESKRISQNAIDGAIETNNLDAIIAPTNSPAWLTDHINGDTYTLSSSSFAAVSGYASITVPAGQVGGLPVGVSFIGGAFSERQLIEIAYAFEQSNNARKPPPGL